jgi:hypothetical protein
MTVGEIMAGVNGRLSEAATEFGQVGIEKPHSTGVCESHLRNSRQIRAFRAKKPKLRLKIGLPGGSVNHNLLKIDPETSSG